MPATARRPKRKTAEPNRLDSDTLLKVDRVAKKKKTGAKKAEKKPSKKEETYEVESIVSFRNVAKEGKKKRFQFEVKWKGYDETTWEPKGNLNAAARKEAEALLAGGTDV